MWRGMLWNTYGALGRSRLAVAAALKLRNQSEMLLARFLGEDSNVQVNGEHRVLELIAGSVGTFVDVGANVGNWSQVLLEIGGAEKKGLLIEPSRAAFQKLEERFGANRNFQLVRAAMSDAEGEARFFEEKNAGEKSLLLESWCAEDAEGVAVRVTTVDSEVAKTGWECVDLLKIDAEGYDFHVIQGARRLLSRHGIGIVQFEYNAPWALAGNTLAAAIRLFEGYGYKVYLARTTGLHPLNYARWGEFYRCTNFVAVSPRMFSLISPLLQPEI